MLIRHLLALLLFGATHGGIAQDYPARTAKMVVPFTAGTANDIVARLFAQKLSDQLKQPFVVENRPGGAGIPGVEYVVRSAPDGHTLLFVNTALLAIQPGLYTKLPYDTQRDLVPVSILATTASVMVVHPSLAAYTVKELIALAKAGPEKLNYASGGNGTPFHLSGELFKANTGTDFVHVPYKGNAPAMIALLAGQVQMMFDSPLNVIPQINSGKLRAIVSTGAKRLALLPDVPTMAEAGFRGAESVSFFAIAAPKGVSRRVIATLHTAIVKLETLPEVRQRLIELATDVVGNTPEEAEVFLRDEVAKWAKVIKDSGAKVDN